MNNQVFISYRRKDGFYPAYLLYKELVENNYTVFFDLKSLRMGEFPSIIKQNIMDCTDFILIVTESTFSERIFEESDWVRQELRLAIENNKNIITVFINATIPDDLPDDIAKIKDFNGIQQLDPNMISENYKKLFTDFMMSHPSIRTASSFKDRRCSAYDVDYGDEFNRLSIQSNNSIKSDLTVFKDIGAHGVVLDVGCAFGAVTVSRFDGDEFSCVLGIDKNEGAVKYATEHSGKKYKYAVIDVEAPTFRDDLNSFMKENGIEGFDIIFISLVLHHLSDPYALLRKLNKFLLPGGKIVVRGIDDGSKLAYPDEKNLLSKIIKKSSEVSRSSDSLHGRKIYDWLKQSGYRNVRIYSFMRDTSGLNMDDRENLFRECFSFRINYFRKQREENPSDKKKFHEFDEMEMLLALFENDFMKENFWYAGYDYIGVATID